MATAAEIPTDLALEISVDFEPKKFVAAAREFFGFVERVSLSPTMAKRPEWRVKVREGSTILGLMPAPTMLAAETEIAYSRIERATKALVSGDFEIAALDDFALEHARKLSDLTKSKDGTVVMRVWVRHQPILFGPAVGESIREETKPAYWDFGSVEGALSAIQGDEGSLELRVRDPLWDRAIKCYVPEPMLGEAMGSFRHRVELFGEVHYRKNGTPDEIRVTRLERLPNDGDLPTIDETRGLLAGLAA